MSNPVNVDFVTKAVEVEVNDTQQESLAAAAAMASAGKAAEKASEATTILTAIRNEYGYPFAASTAADMTDTTKIYVYVGSEEDYTYGDWYYYDGNDWVSGGAYNAFVLETDKTLSVTDMAADAKAVGNKFAYSTPTELKTLLTIAGSIRINGTDNNSAAATSSYHRSDYIPMSKGTIIVYTDLRATGSAGIGAYDSDKVFDDTTYVESGGKSSGAWTMPFDGYVRLCCRNTELETTASFKACNIYAYGISDLNSKLTGLSAKVNTLTGQIIFPPSFKIDLSSYDEVKMYGTSLIYTHSTEFTRRSISFADIADNITGATFDSENNILTIPMTVESMLLLDPIENTVSLSTLRNIPANCEVLLYRYYQSYGGLLFSTSFSRQFDEKVEEALNNTGLGVLRQYQEQIGNVVAASDYYRGAGSVSWGKNLTLLMVADSHGDVDAVLRAVNIANGVDAIDGVLHLGDIGPTSPRIDSDIPMITALQTATIDKPFFLSVGNHDVQYLPDATVYSDVIDSIAKSQPYLNTASMYSERGYGYYDFSAYKVRMIILNMYDYPITTTDDTYDVYGAGIMLQEDQIDMLVDALETLPEDYTVFIASHYSELGTFDDTIIPQHYGTENISNGDATQIGTGTHMSDLVVSDIINAFKNKTTLTKIYTYTNNNDEVIGSISVDADFSQTSGLFACWVCGHRHRNSVARSSVGDYWIYVNDTAYCGTKTSAWATAYSNIPRCLNTNARDLITCLSIDTENKVVKFTRIGAHIDRFLCDTNFVKLNY